MSTSLVRLANAARQLANKSDFGASRHLSIDAPGASSGRADDLYGDTVQVTLTRECTTVSLTVIQRPSAEGRHQENEVRGTRTGCAK